MRTVWILIGGLAGIFLVLFVLVEGLGVPLLTDPEPWLAAGGPTAASIGPVLLIADVLLPVPASLVMIAHGALFGIIGGSLLSLAGGVGAAAFGFLLGRWGRPFVARISTEAERRRARQFLDRWGELAVVASRPVPILAETVAVMAGTAALRWGRFLVAAFAGSVPAALLYAVTGATAARLDSFLLVFALVLLVAWLFWSAGRRSSPLARAPRVLPPGTELSSRAGAEP